MALYCLADGSFAGWMYEPIVPEVIDTGPKPPDHRPLGNERNQAVHCTRSIHQVERSHVSPFC
jgi:hypothetical protein